jgi:multidrug resistance efflux pump
MGMNYSSVVDPFIKGCHRQENAPLKQGDVLFRIDPKPYEYVVDQKKAALAEAEQNVRQFKASLDQAAAATERANAQFALAQRNYDRQSELFQKKVIAQATLDTFTRNLETARQSVTGAKAEEDVRGSPIHRTSRV